MNIKQLEDRFLQEEENYVMNLFEKFQNAWNEVSLGEAIISQTAELFNTGSNSIPVFQVFQMVHMQIRYVASLHNNLIMGPKCLIGIFQWSRVYPNYSVIFLITEYSKTLKLMIAYYNTLKRICLFKLVGTFQNPK